MASAKSIPEQGDFLTPLLNAKIWPCLEMFLKTSPLDLEFVDERIYNAYVKWEDKGVAETGRRSHEL